MQRLVGDHRSDAVGDAEAKPLAAQSSPIPDVERHGTRLAELAVISVWSRSSQLRLSKVATVPVRMMRLVWIPSSLVISPTACSSATCTSASAGIGTVTGTSASGRGLRADRHGRGRSRPVPAVNSKPGAVAEHDPGVRAQHRDVVGDGLALDGPTPMLMKVMPRAGHFEVIGRHLRIARRRWFRSPGSPPGGAAGDDVAGLDRSA